MPPSCTVDFTGGYTGHLRLSDGICILALCDQSYPRAAAFAYLEEVRVQFLEELKREFGSGSVDFGSQLETISKPFYFARFDRQIARIHNQYRNPTSSAMLDRVQADLSQVSRIMRCCIEDIVGRGDSLEHVSAKANTLKNGSKDFAKVSRSLSLQASLTKYLVPLLALAAVLLLVRLAVADVEKTPITLASGFCLVCFLFVIALRTRSRGGGKVDLSFASDYYSDHLHVL
eukprot:CAMPEP_0206461030 /NCGR_PEP_ID=MMETSP0324_2-20121206/25100_1 /ASSEMBLY_ACC=CAM_ASM_000836 /TAXON_ID=2866 /ORGANISM="Crypthecodinium cohnii, Strain Seligo" /LENGTH=230 /DNA_ID=CAMNT_0053932837 /DNA_START=173 /DNA_END=865 /DNA_ORIENTATION=+